MLGIVVCFFHVRYFRYNNPGHQFGKLMWVSILFFTFFLFLFHCSLLVFLIVFVVFFNCFFYWVISDLSHDFGINLGLHASYYQFFIQVCISRDFFSYGIIIFIYIYIYIYPIFLLCN